MRQVPISNNMFAILLLSFFDQIAITISFPVLTFLCFDRHSALFPAATSHAVRSYWFGILSAAPHFAAMFAVIILGLLADHYGRKKILILGACGVLLLSFTSAIGILFANMMLVLVGMLIGGACARTEPIALAAVSDISQPQAKIINMGYLQFAISIGAFIGPLIGGYFANRFLFKFFNFSLPYFIAIIVAVLTILVTQFKFAETLPLPRVGRKLFRINWQSLITAKMLKITLILILTQLSWRLYYQFMPPLLKLQFHYQPMFIGTFLAMIAGCLGFATLFILRWLSHFYNSEQILKIAVYLLCGGLLIAVIGVLLNPGVGATILLWFAALPVAVGDVVAFCAITTMYSDSTLPDEQGQIMAICLIISSLVWVVTGLLGGALTAINIKLPIIVALIPVIIAVPMLNRHRS